MPARWTFFIVLSLRVIALKGKPLFAVLKRAGDDKRSLERTIRGHGNFAKYTPIMLVLMLIAEQSGTSATLQHICGAMFFFGRLAAWQLHSCWPYCKPGYRQGERP